MYIVLTESGEPVIAVFGFRDKSRAADLFYVFPPVDRLLKISEQIDSSDNLVFRRHHVGQDTDRTISANRIQRTG